jgi:hypothetical protein
MIALSRTRGFSAGNWQILLTNRLQLASHKPCVLRCGLYDRVGRRVMLGVRRRYRHG